MKEKDPIPRYSNPEFSHISADSGKTPRFQGGKVIDGVIHYPEGMEIDPERAARAQAFIDYSYRPGKTPAPDPEMEVRYGAPYQERFRQLKMMRTARRMVDGVLHHIPKSRASK